MRRERYDMKNQVESAKVLKSLHIKGTPLIVFNVWDAGSAMAAEEIGFKTIATSSWSVAKAHGYEDGEQISLDQVVANLHRIVKSVNLPVTIDLEGGYGKAPTQVREAVAKVIMTGAVGINLEDQIIGCSDLYSCEEQSDRIKAAVASTSLPIFINARTDIFLKENSANHSDGHLSEALYRAIAYAESGASGFFAPGLTDEKLIEKLCELSPIPINIMISPNGPTPKRLAEIGVSRISYGPIPYCNAMESFKNAGRKALALERSKPIV